MARSGPEAALVKKMRDAAKAVYGERFVSIKYHGSQFSEAGVSDLLCCLDGVFVAVEVKAPESYGNDPSRAEVEGPTLKQKAFIARVQKAGGVGGVVASVTSFLALLTEAEEKGRLLY